MTEKRRGRIVRHLTPILLLLAIVALSHPAAAQSGDPGARPMTRWGTASITQAQVVEEDTSGHGAVLCAWRLYINLRLGLDLCFPNEYPELREDLDYAIAATNRFIVANRKPPTTMDEVEAFVASEEAKQRSQIAQVPPAKFRAACRTNEFGAMVIKIAQTPRAERRKQVDDLLSVPRQPVMNPCM